MPTFRITERQTGRRLGGNVIADTDLSALARVVTDRGDVALVMEDYLIEVVSDNPEPKVFTVVRQDHEDPRKVWEVMTSGVREKAMEEVVEMGKRGVGGVGMVEETVGVNRVMAKGRRS